MLLDAEALRSLATLEGWWEVGPATGGAHPARGGIRAAADGERPRRRGRWRAERRRRGTCRRSPPTPRANGARSSSSKGARTVIASPDGEVAVAPFENPALASGGTGDVLSGTIGSLLAQGLTPSPRLASASTCTDSPGEAVRHRIGDAGLLASDLPDEIAVRASPAGGARRTRDRAAGSASGSREAPPRDRRAERGRASASTHDLASAGLPPLPRTAWLRDRPRPPGWKPRRAPRGAAGRCPRGARRQGRRLRPRRGPGRPRARGWPAPTACASPRGTRRSSCAARGVRLPILVLFPSRRGSRAEAARSAHQPRRSATRRCWRGRSMRGLGRPRSAGGAPPPATRGRGRIGPRARRLRSATRPAVAAIRSTSGVDLAGLWSHIGSPDDPARTAAQLTAFGDARAVLGSAVLARRSDPPLHGRSTSPRAAASSVRPSPRRSAIRPGLSTYGVVPDGLVAARGQVGACRRPAPGHEPPRAAGPGRRPAGRLGRLLRCRFVTDRPEPHRDTAASATPTATSAPDGPRRGRWSAASAVPIVGAIAMDADDGRRDRRARSAGHRRRRVRAARVNRATRTLTAVDLARSGTTISWEVLAGMSRRLPRVYYAAARAVGVRTLTDEPGSDADRSRSPATTPVVVGGHPEVALLRAAEVPRMNLPREIEADQRDDLVERVAREIQLRGLTTPAVHFLQASRPYRSLGAHAMLFFDPVLRGVFGGRPAARQRDHGRRRRDRAADRPPRRARRRSHLGRLTRASERPRIAVLAHRARARTSPALRSAAPPRRRVPLTRIRGRRSLGAAFPASMGV